MQSTSFAKRKADRWGGLAVLMMLGAVLILRYWNNWPIDLSALYFAAYFYELGDLGLIYASNSEPISVQGYEEWRDLALSQGYEPRLFPSYIYPPVWAALAGPLAHSMSYVSFANCFLLVFVILTLAMIVLSYAIGRHVGTIGRSFTVWCVASSIIVGFTSFSAVLFQLGQPQIIVSFLLILCLCFTIWGRDIAAGGLLALAAAIKLMPALMVVFFVMERRWKALIAFVCIGAVLGIGSIVAVGWPLHQTLLDKVATFGDHVLISRLSIGVETIAYHVSQLKTGAAELAIDSQELVSRPGGFATIRYGFLGAGLVSVWWLSKGHDVGLRLWVRFVSVYLLIALSASLAWMHYLILPALLAPVVWCFKAPTTVKGVLLVCLALTTIPVYLILLDSRIAGYSEVYLHIGVALAVFAALHSIPKNQQG